MMHYRTLLEDRLSMLFSACCTMQVSEWIQRILNIGAAFAGADGAKGLRGLLTAQAGNFFRCAHLLHMHYSW